MEGEYEAYHVVAEVFVVVLTLTRTIKFVVTGQAPVTLAGLKKTPKKNTSKPNVVHAYILAEAIHASAKKYDQMKSAVSPRTCQAHTAT